MKYPELINWLLKLSEVKTFKSVMDDYFNHHDPYNQEKRNYDTGELTMLQHAEDRPTMEEVVYSFDEQIYYVAYHANSKVATEILKPLRDKNKENKLFEWKDDIELATGLTNTNSFYLNFPNYLKALRLTFKNIEKLITRFSLEKKGKRGNKKWKGLSIDDKVIIISHAMKLLRSNPEDYKPRRGAKVSERMKDQVADDLKQTIEGISRHKVARVLLNYYANILS